MLFFYVFVSMYTLSAIGPTDRLVVGGSTLDRPIARFVADRPTSDRRTKLRRTNGSCRRWTHGVIDVWVAELAQLLTFLP